MRTKRAGKLVKCTLSSPQASSRLPKVPRIARSTVSFAALIDEAVPPHTLIIGTHPSIISFAREQYFGHPANAFWWIVGDALRFRRDAGKKASGEPAGRVDYFEALRYEEPLLDYESGLKELTSRGFALWDVVGACSREGSLDVDIDADSVVTNNVQGLCIAQPTIRRICLGSGQETAKIFLKHHAAWVLRGAFRLPEGEDVPPAFAPKKWRDAFGVGKSSYDDGRLTLAVMPSVSPAAAGITYVAKREAWERLCFAPGLRDHEAWQSDCASTAPRTSRFFQ